MKNKVNDSRTLDANDQMRGIDCGRFLPQRIAVSDDGLSIADDSTLFQKFGNPS
jgi:hypothetical protein